MSAPPPPKAGSRSFKQMKDDIKRLQEENARLKQLQDQKEAPSAESIARRNPNRMNPNPNQPVIKLMDYSTDWIEQDRSNVVVELNSDFEDPIIEPHTRIVARDNLSLLGLADHEKVEVTSTYSSFSVLNLAYRLLLTLPSNYRLEARNLIEAIKADDVPQNTAVICEMYSHIGKTKTDHYGNLRLAYPLQLAKKKICKAMCIVKDIQYFQDEFQLVGTHTLDELDNVWRTGIFKDKDAPDFIARQGFDVLDKANEEIWRFKIGNHDVMFSLPDRMHEKYFKNGRYKPTPGFVSQWCQSTKILRLIDDEKFKDAYYKMCCAMIAQIVNLDFMQGKKTLSQVFPDFKANDFKALKWEDFSTYLGIVELDTYVTSDMLANNYFIISDYYKTISEKHVKNVFKVSNIKKEEFGTDAQMLICSNWQKDGNNAVDTSFKVNDKNKAVAAGIFNFTKKVDINVSDRMHMKNSFRSMISNLISHFARK